MPPSHAPRMDNEDFRALVSAGRAAAAPSTTKEIAREAVEAEFRERRQQRRALEVAIPFKTGQGRFCWQH